MERCEREMGEGREGKMIRRRETEKGKMMGREKWGREGKGR